MLNAFHNISASCRVFFMLSIQVPVNSSRCQGKRIPLCYSYSKLTELQREGYSQILSDTVQGECTNISNDIITRKSLNGKIRYTHAVTYKKLLQNLINSISCTSDSFVILILVRGCNFICFLMWIIWSSYHVLWILCNLFYKWAKSSMCLFLYQLSSL